LLLPSSLIYFGFSNLEKECKEAIIYRPIKHKNNILRIRILFRFTTPALQLEFMTLHLT